MKVRINQTALLLKVGDITAQSTEAIVNAANASLRGGGGVDDAIHRAGGPSIMEECRTIGYCPPGDAAITSAGFLKAKYVIHAVGPIYLDGRHEEDVILRRAYQSCLELASRYGIRSLSFPALSTGAYGYPLHPAARIALETVIRYLEGHTDITEVDFVLFNEDTYQVFRNELQKLLSSE